MIALTLTVKETEQNCADMTDQK